MNEYDPQWYDLYFNGVEGDVEFYLGEAQDGRGPTLEIGCGTGRILIPLAREAGVPVTGLDISKPLLKVALAKLKLESDAVQERSKIVEGDMRDFDLGETFATVILPYRTFQHLLTPVDQLSALKEIRRHLGKNGRLVFNIFEPTDEIQRHGWSTPLRLDAEVIDSSKDEMVSVYFSRLCDPQTQLMEQSFIFERWDNSGKSKGRYIQNLSLRWSTEWEMRHVFNLTGFSVVAFYGDFGGNPYPGFGEQIWVLEAD
ncbi:MAG: class I SAM-dependent methyltransferase [Candidatus Latescibacterota bacterium]|nr:class I SAM-dependent methyltransferase [Candidatus Latescibacterota bacterium]